jgi:hypothetical protein
MPLDERERARLEKLERRWQRLISWADGETLGPTASASDLSSALVRLQNLIKEDR